MLDEVFCQFKTIKDELCQIKHDLAQQIQRIEHDKIDIIQELKNINKEINLMKDNYSNQMNNLKCKQTQDSINLFNEVVDIKTKITQVKEENAKKERKN